jgi:hypothetical protein
VNSTLRNFLLSGQHQLKANTIAATEVTDAEAIAIKIGFFLWLAGRFLSQSSFAPSLLLKA